MSQQNYKTTVYQDLRQMLRASVSRQERKIFLTQHAGAGMQAISYRGFLSRVNALGTALCSMGLQGKKFVIMGENSIDWVTCYMAVVCGVGVAVPVGRELARDSLDALAEAADVDVLVLSEKCKKRLGAFPKKRRVILIEELPRLIEKGSAALKKGDRSFLDAPIDPEAMAVLLYPTGTTAGKNGVMLSHRNLCFNLAEICKMVRFDESDLFYSALPMHHAYEMTCGFLCPLFCGSSVVFGRGLRYLEQDLYLHRPTVMLTVPRLTEVLWESYLERIERLGQGAKLHKFLSLSKKIKSEKARRKLQKRLFAAENRPFGGQLRLLISAGAAADPTLLSALCSMGITALQGYCMTECAPIIALNRDSYHSHASAGLATPETLLDITHVHSDGTGEIRFRGENVMLGYYNDPVLTAERMQGGWFYTGDLGYIDENGFLYITGRKRDVIVAAGGKDVYPEELEAALEKMPFIKESLVTGVFNAKRKNSDVIAMLRPDMEALALANGEERLREALILEMKKAVSGVNATLQPHQQIKGFLICQEEFERNTSGKVLRKGIAEEAASQVKKGLLYR